MFGIGKFFKRVKKVAKLSHASWLKEAYLLWRVYPKLKMTWEEWLEYRGSKKCLTPRTWMRSESYFIWGATVNPVECRILLNDKKKTFERLGPDIMGRAYCATDEATVEDIVAFWEKYPKLFQKARSATLGAGAARLPEGLSAAEKRAYAATLQGHSCLLEPYIQSHPAVREVIPDSVSSLRINTIRHKDEVRLCLLCVLSFGRKGDNASNQNKAAYRLFFRPNGERFCQQAYCNGQLVEVHEDTGYHFERFQVPDWEQCVALVKRAALLLPEIPFVGWDIAFTPEGPIIIEANGLSATPLLLQNFFFAAGYPTDILRKLFAIRHFARTGHASTAFTW